MSEDRKDMPQGIMPTTDTPAGYSPEYLADGRVWLLFNGKRLRLLRNHREFAIAAQMAGGYAGRHTWFEDWPEAPFVWQGAAPQYDPPPYVHPAYMISFRIGWPMLEITVSVDHAIWRLWKVVKASKHAGFIRQFDPVSSWFEHWIDPELVIEMRGGRYIRRRDLHKEIARLGALIKAT